MTDRDPILPWILTAFSLLAGVGAQAQQPPREPYGVRVEALTSAERDSLSHRLQASGEGRVVFACVPAGVLVLADADHARSVEEGRTAMRAALTAVIPAARLSDDRLTLQAAENSCAQARGR